MKKFIRNARLNYDELSTVLVEVEAALNSRPLTYVFDEMEEPLTPSHLIVGRRILSVPSKSSSDEVGQTEETLTRRAKFLQRILDHSGTDGGQNISHNLENAIAILREQTLSLKCKWEILCVYMTIRSRDSCGALERSNDYFQDEMVEFEVQ